ncbi:MAG: hypothetical protein RL193_167 [Actinomycetota bacterium]
MRNKKEIDAQIQKKLDKFRKAFPNADEINYKNLDSKHDHILKRLKLEGGLNSINLSNLRNWSMQNDMGISRVSKIKLPAFFDKMNSIVSFLYSSFFEKFFRKSFYDSLKDDLEILKLIESYDILTDNPVAKTPGETQWFSDGNTTYNLRWLRYTYFFGRIRKENLLTENSTWVDIGSFYGGLQSVAYKYFPNVKYVMVDFHHQLFRSYLFLSELYPNANHLFGFKETLGAPDGSFCYIPTDEFQKIDSLNCELVSNFFSFGEMRRESFIEYQGSNLIANAKKTYNVNRIVSAPFFDPTYDTDLTVYDYNFKNQKIVYFDIFPIHHFQSVKRELFGIKRPRNISSSYFEMITENIKNTSI